MRALDVTVDDQLNAAVAACEYTTIPMPVATTRPTTATIARFENTILRANVEVFFLEKGLKNDIKPPEERLLERRVGLREVDFGIFLSFLILLMFIT